MEYYAFQLRENHFSIMNSVQLFKSILTVFSFILYVFTGTAALANSAG